MSCRFAHLDGAYVLGSLSPAERADYERHLRSCETCAPAVRELAGLPGLLSRVPADVLELPAREQPVPDTLLPALVTRAEREQRRRTTRLGLIAAAAVALVAVGTAGVTAALQDEAAPPAPPSAGPTTAPPQEMQALGSGAVTGWVSLTPVAWGTRLDLDCEYRQEPRHHFERGDDHGYGSGADGVVYTMLVRTTDGRVEEAATWRGLPGSEMHVTGATSAVPADIASVVVRTSGGEAVLRLTP